MKLLILLVVGYLCYRVMKNWIMAGERPREHVSTGSREQIDDVMIQDPACGVYVARENAVRAKIDGEVLHFCSPECRDSYLNRQKQS